MTRLYDFLFVIIELFLQALTVDGTAVVGTATASRGGAAVTLLNFRRNISV